MHKLEVVAEELSSAGKGPKAATVAVAADKLHFCKSRAVPVDWCKDLLHADFRFQFHYKFLQYARTRIPLPCEVSA